MYKIEEKIEIGSDLDKGLGIDLVNGVSRGSAWLVVKEVALNKYTVFAHALYPDFSLVLFVQNYPCEGVSVWGCEFDYVYMCEWVGLNMSVSVRNN